MNLVDLLSVQLQAGLGRDKVKCSLDVQSDLYYPRYLGVLNFGPKNRG